MKQKTTILMGMFLIFLASLFLTSCMDEPNNDKSDAPVALDPHNAVNIDMKVTHADTYDLLTTTKTIHDGTGAIVRVLTSVDTLPRLGMVSDTLDTHRTYQDDNGDDQEIDTVIRHPKDYQLYISVKK